MADTKVPLMQRKLLPRSAKTHEVLVAAVLYYLSDVLVDPPEA